MCANFNTLKDPLLDLKSIKTYKLFSQIAHLSKLKSILFCKQSLTNFFEVTYLCILQLILRVLKYILVFQTILWH